MNETLCPFCGERTPAEPDAQLVYCIHCKRRIELDAACAEDLTQASTREQVLEKLLGDCICAMEALLMSPDLNLDCLEQVTLDAIEVSRETLHAVKGVLEKEKR